MEMILIADHDLGFVFWLGAALSEAGYFVLPAKNVRRARQMARQIGIDLVIANPSLVGIAEFIGSLRSERPHLKLIAAIKGAEFGTGNLTEVDGVLSKSARSDEITKREWVEQVAALTGEAVFAH